MKPLILITMLAVSGAPTFAQGLPELNETVVNGSYSDLEKKLQERPWSKDDLGAALIGAAGVDKPREAALLLESGADVDFAVLWRTSLIVAAYKNSTEAALVLLEAGADPNYKSTFDWRPLHNAMRKGVSNDGIILLLLKHGAEIDARTNLQVTPLHRAAGFCLASAVKVLVEHGASKELRDKYGLTAAKRAEKAGCFDVADMLR